MSARKYPKWLPPVAFVGILGIALVFSNQAPELPGGGVAISSDAEYQDAKIKMEELTKGRLQALDAGKTLSPEDLKKLREASEILDRMNLYSPLKSGLHFLSGKIHLALGEDQIASERFRQCAFVATNEIAIEPQNTLPIKLTAAEASYQLSMLLLVQRDLPGAFKAADEAVKTVPQSPNYLVARGSALNELRRPAEAKRDLLAALKLDPNNSRAKGILRLLEN